jgi:hypothetical protein
MSDEDDDRYSYESESVDEVESYNSDDEDKSEHSSNDSNNAKDLIKLNEKSENIENDLMLLSDIFSHCNRVKSRISERLNLEYETNQLRLEKKNIESNLVTMQAQLNEKNEMKFVREEELITPRVKDSYNSEQMSWSQYENLDEVQRASLLERAIAVLSNDENKGRSERRNRKK